LRHSSRKRLWKLPAPLSLECSDDVVTVEDSAREQEHPVPDPQLVKRGDLEAEVQADLLARHELRRIVAKGQERALAG
jgi:hypothetical protein